jgi:hypothetical protein
MYKLWPEGTLTSIPVSLRVKNHRMSRDLDRSGAGFVPCPRCGPHLEDNLCRDGFNLDKGYWKDKERSINIGFSALFSHAIGHVIAITVVTAFNSPEVDKLVSHKGIYGYH